MHFFYLADLLSIGLIYCFQRSPSMNKTDAVQLRLLGSRLGRIHVE